MDLSSKYIEMCVKAEELQSEWKPREGDFYAEFAGMKKDILVGIAVFHKSKELDPSYLQIWLPRQDQLQEMIPDGLAWKHVLFDEWIREQKGNWLTGDIKGFESFEQLWLAFVMWIRYRKVWDNERKEWKVFEDYRIVKSDVKEE